MLEPGDRFENQRTGALEVVSTSRGGDALVLERLYKPHTGRADPHVHFDFDHVFEVLDGQMSVTVDGDERTLGPGESLRIPARTPHVDPWNASEADLRVRSRFEPTPEFVEGFVEMLGHHMREDSVNEQGEFPQLQLFVLLHGYNAKSYATGIPIPVQKATMPVLAAVGRMRGYGVHP